MHLGFRSKERWQKAAEALAAGKPPGRWQRALLRLELPALARCLAAAGPRLGVDARRQLSEWLAKQGLLGSLLAMLAHGEPGERVLAAEALGWTSGQDSLQPLLQALADRQEDLNFAASRALGVLEAHSVSVNLVGMLLSGQGLPARVAEALAMRGREAVEASLAAYAGAGQAERLLLLQVLGELAHPDALDALLAALAEGNAAQRVAAADALGRIKAAAAVPALLEALRDGQWEVRCRAAQALGALGEMEARDELAAALHDPQGGVRAAAQEALAALGMEGDAGNAP